MFSQVSVCPQLASWILVHCSALLRRGQYASYWNAFFFKFIITLLEGQNMYCHHTYSTVSISSIFNRPQHSCSKVMFLHLSVILFMGGRLADTPPK